MLDSARLCKQKLSRRSQMTAESAFDTFSLCVHIQSSVQVQRTVILKLAEPEDQTCKVWLTVQATSWMGHMISRCDPAVLYM